MMKGCLSKWGPEIIYLLYKTGNFMLDTTIRLYVTTAVCREMFITETTRCSSQSFLNDHEASIQEKTAAYLTYYRVLLYVPSFILGFYWGAWSDQAGRKLPMIIPNLGGVFGILLYLTMWYFPRYTLVLFLTGTAVQGVLCTTTLIKVAVTAYVVENTSPVDVTRRLSILMAMNNFGQFLGSLLAGALQDTTTVQVTLCVASSLHACTLICSVLCIHEEHINKEETNDSAFRNAILGIHQTVNVIAKKRLNKSRCRILLLCAAACFQSFCYTGDVDIPVLYIKNKPLQWPESWYGYYIAVEQVARVSGLLLLQPLLSKKFNVSDIMLLLIGLVWGVIRSIWTAFSLYSWMMWLAAVFGFMGGLTISLVRALLSKEVDTDELGKVFSFVESIDILFRPAASAMYIAVYTLSMHYFPGMAFMVEGLVYLLFIVIAVCLCVNTYTGEHTKKEILLQ